MKIHVENRDTALASVQRALGSDGGIIKKAVAAELIHRRVVARRTAQAEGRLTSSEGMIGCRQRGIFTCHGSGKGAFRNRSFSSKGVVAQLAAHRLGNTVTAHRTGWPDIGDGLARVARRLPCLPAVFQERDVISIVNRQHGRKAVVTGRTNFKRGFAQGSQYQIHPLGALKGGN